MNFYKYCVTYYSDFTEKTETCTGITTADSYKDATEKLGNFYGDDAIERMMIECFASDEVYECDTKDFVPKFY